MAFSVYSKAFFDETGLTVGAHSIGPVPAGFVWVVRDIDSYNDGVTSAAVAGWSLSSVSGGAPFAGVPSGWAQCGQFYQWSGRQVIDEGDELALEAFGSGWSVRISGYQLTLP